MEKKRVTVRVAGKDYHMTSSDSEAYVRRVASYVDRKINDLGLAVRMSPADLAVMTAITIADDAFKAQDEVTRLRVELDKTRQALDELRREQQP